MSLCLPYRPIAASQGTRNSMEDAVAVVENTPPPPAPVSYCVYCVLDGHGGHDCSLFTARTLPQMLLQNLAKVPPPKDTPETPVSPKAGASVAEVRGQEGRGSGEERRGEEKGDRGREEGGRGDKRMGYWGIAWLNMVWCGVVGCGRSIVRPSLRHCTRRSRR